MKTLKIFVWLSLFITLTASQCFKRQHDPYADLPAATQTGRGIFACHINGKSFIGRPYNCFYQYNYGRGRHYLAVRGDDRSYKGSTEMPWVVSFGSNMDIHEGMILYLSTGPDSLDHARAHCFYTDKDEHSWDTHTDSTHTGEVHITKFDTHNYILSGTFWFDVVHPLTGEIVEVRDGRFDVKFSR